MYGHPDDGHQNTTTTKPEHEYTTTTKAHDTTTTQPREVTTTTHKPHDTTTTEKVTTTTECVPQQTTTTKPGGGGTTTTRPGGGTTTTTGGGNTTTTRPGGGGTTTTFPTPTRFTVNVIPVCPAGVPSIQINFPTNATLNGQSGILDFSDGTSYGVLVYNSGGSITIPWPASLQSPLTLTYRIQGQTATATVTLPPNCLPGTTTTTTGGSTSTSTTGPTTTTGPSTTTTTPGATTTTAPGTTTTTLPGTFTFGAAATVCQREVPTIVINFRNTFPELAGRTGTLTFADVNGNVVGSQPLVYQPNTTVTVLYPGTAVNPDGSIADVPGWILQPNGLWVRDPSDEFLREGINLTYTVNPTATAFVTYPPESANCANPDNPPPTPGRPGIPTTTRPGLPPTE